MDVKETIKWLNNFKVCLDDVVYCDDDKKLTLKELQDVSSFLQELEKYKKILEGIKSETKGNTYWEMIIKNQEQKYFPQPVKKVITIEVETKNKIAFKMFSEELNKMTNEYFSNVKVNIREVKYNG